MRNVYLVTHPEASHHRDGRVGGWFDSPLTEKGRADASLIAAAVREMIPSHEEAAVFSSDLRRTIVVAQDIARLLGVEALADADLREKSYGEAEGHPQAWLDDRFVPPPETGDRMNHHEGIDGAETKGEFARRIYAAMDRCLASHAPHVVIVTHGFAATFVIAAWARLPIESLGYLNVRVRSGSVSLLREDDFFHNRQLVSIDSLEHLNR